MSANGPFVGKIGSMRTAIVLGLAALLAFSAGCGKPPAQAATSQINSATRIESLPAADPQKLPDSRNLKSWKNPYLIVRIDGVALLDVADNEQKLLNPDKLADALAQLPSSSWPYGRAVAVAEQPATSDFDKTLLRKNRALIAGTLEGLHVLINWVPSS